MKRLLLLLLIAPMFVKAQTDTTKFELEFVNTAKGTQNDLYVKARNWADNLLQSSKRALQIDRPDELRFKIYFESEKRIDKFTCEIEIDIKDGKYRFHSSDYMWGVGDIEPNFPLSSEECPKDFAIFSSKSKRQQKWLQTKDEAINKTKEFYNSLVADMQKSASDNW